MSLKFRWNGIQGEYGRLQTCRYSEGELINYPKGTITIYKKDYTPFSQEVKDAFRVDNGTDIQSDYFEKDRIRVEPSHPLYAAVKAAIR